MPTLLIEWLVLLALGRLVSPSLTHMVGWPVGGGGLVTTVDCFSWIGARGWAIPSSIYYEKGIVSFWPLTANYEYVQLIS